MSVESRVLALLFLALSAAATAQEQVFEPGSKHVCVPAASGEGWDCHSAEGAAPAAANEAKPREPRLRSSSQVAEESPKAEAAAAEPATSIEPLAPATPAQTTSAPPAAVAAPRENSRNVPNYLLAPEARTSGAPAPTRPAPAPPVERKSQPATPAPAPAAPPPVAAAPEPARAPPPSEPVAATPAPEPAPAPVATPEPRAPEPIAETPAPRVVNPQPVAPPPPAPRESPLLGAAEFRRLGDSRYVIELASGNRRDAVESEASLYAHSNVYLLTLQRNGEAWYLAVRGDFDSVDAARAARAEMIASGATQIGWPRRAGPLKQELGR
jgi:hypothetical protein